MKTFLNMIVNIYFLLKLLYSYVSYLCIINLSIPNFLYIVTTTTILLAGGYRHLLLVFNSTIVH